jgi:CIC family chloride channel protein
MAAVFGSAARVPIATLLMVTEMTGGYELLVPAALAVSLAYVAQDLLSGKLKYRSLYEAQVDRRSDSPAHRTEHLQEAIEMLAEKKALHPDIVGSLDITELLKSSLSFELPDGNQLAIATVDKGSRCVGMSIKDSCGIENHRQFEVAAIERGEHLIFPDQDTILKEGDQLLIFGKQDTIEEFKKKLLQKN